MRAISGRAWLYVVISAALQVLIFPVAGPLPTWTIALTWVALVPLLAALLLPRRDGRRISIMQAGSLGYLCGTLWYLGNCSWIYQTMYLYGGLPKPAALGILVLFALYLGLYHALFAMLFALCQRTRLRPTAALLSAPFLWVGVELSRARITGFPWDLLGYSQVNNLFLTRLAPLAGVMAISFVIAAVNAALVPLLLLGPRRYAVPIAGCLFAAALELAGLVPVPAVHPLHYATMMQENLLVGKAAHDSRILSNVEEIDEFARWSEHPIADPRYGSQDRAWVAASSPVRSEIVIWPEAPSHLQSNDPFFREAAGQLARETGAAVIAGSLGVDLSDASPRGYFLFDSASLFSANGSYQSRYDKIHLVPWGEYVPYKQFFAFADKLTEGVGDMDRGTRRTVFSTGGHSYGVFICYESIFGDEVREFVENGADVLVNISDDGWYGDTGAPWQHLNMARMRAIENRRWLLRSTNTGVTAAIDPQGRIAEAAPRHVRAAFTFPFDFVTGETFYTRHGDWFAWLCVVATVSFAGAAIGWPAATGQID